MATASQDRQPEMVRELNRAMAASLRLILNDIWAQYRSVRAAAEQLKNAGGAAGDLYKQVCSMEEAMGRKQNGKADPNRHVRRTRV
jgi:hypothetical protein